MEQRMQALSPASLLGVWETGRPQHPLDRALTILVAATPGASRDALADLSIGARDARLLQLRALVFGRKTAGFAECPQCDERIEIPLDTAAFAEPKELPASAPEIQIKGERVQLRLPTSRDLAAVIGATDKPDALRILLARCAGRADLPNDTAEAVAAACLAADPHAEILLRVICPVCAHEWNLPFDIADFFWKEIASHAQRLLREIDVLARAYGWTEHEILNLSVQRRQTYLELIAA
jgi:hypothetical protein